MSHKKMVPSESNVDLSLYDNKYNITETHSHNIAIGMLQLVMDIFEIESFEKRLSISYVDLLQAIDYALTLIPPLYSKTIIMRYGIDGQEPKTYYTIANIIHTSAEMVRRYIIRALDSLRVLYVSYPIIKIFYPIREMNELLNNLTDLRKLGISSVTVHHLFDNGITTFKQLMSCTLEDIKSLPIISMNDISDLCKTLEKYNLSLNHNTIFDNLSKNDSINLLGLSKTIVARLNQSHILTIKQLTNYTRERLLSIEGIGICRFKHIQDALKEHGYTLQRQKRGDEMPISKLDLSDELKAKLESIGIHSCYNLLSYSEYDLLFDLEFDMCALNQIIIELHKFHFLLKKKFGLYSVDKQQFIAFSQRAFYFFMNNKIYTLEKLCSYSYNRLLRMRGMGVITAKEIHDALSKANLTLR